MRRRQSLIDEALQASGRLPLGLATAAARRAAARGDGAFALATAPSDIRVLNRLGMHRAATEAPARSRADHAAQAASLALLGDLAGARRAALTASPLTGSERRRLAAAVAIVDPAWAGCLLPPADRVNRAASALAQGFLDSAESLLTRAWGGQQALYLAAAVAAHRGEWREARLRLNAAFAADGLLPPLGPAEAAPSLSELASARASAVADGPLISIIMAARDAAGTLEAAARSVLNQSWRNLELIVVDDGSRDATLAIAGELARGDERVRLLSHRRPAGPYVARNRGLRAARGRLVALNDADDWSHPQRLELQARSVIHGGAASVCRYFRLDEAGRPVCPRVFPFVRMTPITLVARAEAIERVGPFEETMLGADSEWLARADHLLGRRAIKRLKAAAYVASWRAGSLSNSLETGLEGKGRLERLSYVERWRVRHAEAHRARRAAGRDPLSAETFSHG